MVSRMVGAAAAATVLLGAAAARGQEPHVLPVAGVEMRGALPVRAPGQDAPAGGRRLWATCLSTLPGGAMVLCTGRRLSVLEADGHVRRLPVTFSPPGTFAGGFVKDADAAPDGTVAVLDDAAVWRVALDGTRVRLGSFRSSLIDVRVAAAPGGGAEVLDGDRIVSFAADGTRRVRWRAAAREPFVDAFAALPGGALVLAIGRELRRVGADGTETVLARLGGRASAVAASPDGRLVVASAAGLRVVEPDGRIVAITGLGAWPGRTPGSVSIGGLPAALATLPPPDDVGFAGGAVVALVRAGVDLHAVAIAALDVAPRFAVALPPANRSAAGLPAGVAEILATDPATATLELFRGGQRVDVRTVTLARGTTRLPVATVPGTAPVVARVAARDGAGRVAVHHLRFLPGPTLDRRSARRLADELELHGATGAAGYGVDRCRRTAADAFRCRWREYGDGVVFGRGDGVLRLEASGLVSWSAVTRRGRALAPVYLEPR